MPVTARADAANMDARSLSLSYLLSGIPESLTYTTIIPHFAQFDNLYLLMYQQSSQIAPREPTGSGQSSALLAPITISNTWRICGELNFTSSASVSTRWTMTILRSGKTPSR